MTIRVIPALILKPTVTAAIDVQHQAGQRPPRTPLAMHSSLAPSPHQSGTLQRQLHPGVAQLDLVLVLQLLLEMPHVQIEIPIAVEPQHLLHPRHRHPFGRGLALPPVEQTVIAKLLVTLSPAPHLPITDADDLGRLPPRDPFRHGSQNHFLYFHRPLHRGLRVGNHAPHSLLLSPPAKRTDHLLSQPDISCASDRYPGSVLNTVLLL